MEIRAVVFDLGGTLIDYTGPFTKWPDLETPGFMAAYNLLRREGVVLPKFLKLRDSGFRLLPARWQQAADGERNLRLVDLLAEVLEECRVTNVASFVLEEAAEAYQKAVRSQATLMPAVQETLGRIEASGYKVGLLSNTMFTGKAHKEDLERFKLSHFFETMLFSADVNKWKPNAEPFLQVLDELGVQPSASVYVGDDPKSDVVGGRRAGMLTIHVKTSTRFRQSDGVVPDAEIKDLTELEPLLSKWSRGKNR